MHMNIGKHPADDVLESYLLNRLPEAQVASVEEHLLVCSRCQTQVEQIEEFILVTKAALSPRQTKPMGLAARASSRGALNSWITVPLFAGLAAAAFAAIFIPLHNSKLTPPPAEVRLQTLRGSEALPPHVSAAGGLVLYLDTTGLSRGGDYTIHLIDSHGSPVWAGTPQPAETQIRVDVKTRIRPGRYWVRLTRGDSLL